MYYILMSPCLPVTVPQSYSLPVFPSSRLTVFPSSRLTVFPSSRLTVPQSSRPEDYP